MATRFDRISEVYDETREPLTAEAVDKVASFLRSDGSRSVLEVGVGTGRIAGPLSKKRIDIVGVDLSRRMLEKAKAKGLCNLALADANLLPFGDGNFDAVLMAHVLHLLEDPAKTFGRVARSARNEAVVIYRRRDGSPPAISEERREIWIAFRKAAEEIGYSLQSPPEDYLRRFRKETEFLESFPPDEVITIQDTWISTTLGDRLSMFEKRAYGFHVNIPDEVFHDLIGRVKTMVDPGRQVQYRRVEQMGVWRRGRLSEIRLVGREK